MAKSGEATKQRILDATEGLVFQHGFAATSIDSVLGRTGLTKGAFFYHFKNKAALGQALIERFAARDEATLEEFMRRAEKLSDDPLQQILIFIGLMKEPFENLPKPPPGCLFASYIYQPMEIAPGAAGVAADAVLKWRARLVDKLAAAVERHPVASAVDLDDLADHLTVVLEGAYVVSKVLDDPSLPVRQLELFRRHIEALFVKS